MTEHPKNIAASVRARLQRLAEQRREDFQLLLTRYANERLLHRLSVSAHAPQFVLKGAALFTLWTGRAHRATRDLDRLGFGNNTVERVRAVFDDLLRLNVEDDGIAFVPGSLTVARIREAQEYGGIRAVFDATLGNARIRLQVDVGFGDAVTPAAQLVEFPALLDFPAPKLRAYPRETVVAEKLDAMVQLGMANSRMKDFFDVVLLSRMFDFDGSLLARAIRATFDRRGTLLPTRLPVALTPEFANDATKRTQWSAFLRKSSASIEPSDLASIVARAADFVSDPLAAAASDAAWAGLWAPGGPWTIP